MYMIAKCRLSVVVALSICSLLPAIAQDTLTLLNGNRITALVNEVLPTEIKYKKFDNPDGPVYTVLKEEVVTIRYRNGTMDEFSIQPVQTERQIPAVPSVGHAAEGRSFSELTRRGSSVFVDIPDPASRAGERYFVEALQEWGYWKIVPKLEDADLIVVFNIDKEIMLDKSAFVVLKDGNNNELGRSRSYRASTTAFNGYNAFRAIALKVVRKYFEVEFH